MSRDQSSSVALSKHVFEMSSASHSKDPCCLIQASLLPFGEMLAKLDVGMQ